jgi:hypothetical protein
VVQKYFSLIILAIIVISVVPIGIGWLVEKKKGKKKS